MSRLGEKVRPQRWASSSPASHSKPPTLWFSPSLWGGLDGPSALKTEVTVGQKPKGSDSSYAGGGDSQMLFFFAIHDKHCFELPFIQILTCMLFVWYSQWSTLRDFWWHIILWDLTTLFWPCGCCWGLHHLQIFLWNSTGETYQMDEDWTDVFAENQ